MDQLLANAYTYIMKPVIGLLFGVAVVMFIWGIVQFIAASETDAGRAQGKRNIIYGIIGMVIMVSVFGIINIITGTIGAPERDELPDPFPQVQNAG